MSDQICDTADRQRLRAHVRGAVQGVGFRPFVYRLATELELSGWVLNSTGGVTVEVEGPYERLAAFLVRLDRERPPRSFIQSLESSFLEPVGYTDFSIRESIEGTKTALVVPDIATCPDCLRELFDPADRRYRYPFTNCTNCGPRFTIITALPYDRPNTSMAGFVMCDQCRAEYENPRDRRFHAQPNACPVCGPHVELWDSSGRILARDDEAMLEAASAIRDGAIVAVKGLGGFHLVADAGREDVVVRLRRLKGREEKPFALMYPSLDAVTADCEVSDLERRLLASPEAPIVLLRRRGAVSGRGGESQRRLGARTVAEAVAPGNPCLGVMVPYTPLHHLLLSAIGRPVVATSGNVSDEPICTDEHEALARLGQMADRFLVHNRPIVRHADDSIVRVVLGREMMIRRARGYAPLPVPLAHDGPPVLAVGAHLKNTIALAVGENVFVSQHIGDLETTEALGAFQRVIEAFERLYERRAAVVACDLHPDYLSTRWAARSGRSVVPVQHHHAHVLACMAENRLEGPVLGVSWDGTGYGLDATVWGGEFLRVGLQSWERVAHLRQFRLPGGERAIKEPYRTALGVLFEIFGPAAAGMTDLAPMSAVPAEDRRVLLQMLERGINAPRTSSVGRLFDAVASLVGLRQQVRFEGQAAMELEWAIGETSAADAYPLDVVAGGQPMIVDWEPLVKAVVADVRAGAPRSLMAARFHNALVELVVDVARRVGEQRVVLTGGCFQNVYLTERTVTRLRAEGFQVAWHQRIPPNDGGIALGQVVAARDAYGSASGRQYR